MIKRQHEPGERNPEVSMHCEATGTFELGL